MVHWISSRQREPFGIILTGFPNGKISCQKFFKSLDVFPIPVEQFVKNTAGQGETLRFVLISAVNQPENPVIL